MCVGSNNERGWFTFVLVSSRHEIHTGGINWLTSHNHSVWPWLCCQILLEEKTDEQDTLPAPFNSPSGFLESAKRQSSLLEMPVNSTCKKGSIPLTCSTTFASTILLILTQQREWAAGSLLALKQEMLAITVKSQNTNVEKFTQAVSKSRIHFYPHKFSWCNNNMFFYENIRTLRILFEKK